MQFFLPSGQQPIMWWRSRPIHLTTLLIGLHVLALVITAILMHFGLSGLLMFDARAVFAGQVWRAVSFVFVQTPTFWILIELLMLWMFGTQVESVLGWRKFLGFYLLLCYFPALFLLAFAAWIPAGFGGTDAANFAVFIGFATLFPDAPMLFNTKAKWWAWGLLGLIALQTVAGAGILGLISLLTAGVAYAALKFQGVRGGFQWVNRLSEQRQERRVRRERRRREAESSDQFISKRVDPILDKISRHGIHSLTEEEKRILERAKDKLR